MMFTLTWKEIREHRAIWVTMVLATVLMGLGAAQVVWPRDRGHALQVAAVTILGMAVTYGVVCGAMMFAGEHENGTLMFLDVFLGRRDVLWVAKALIGAGLAISEALAVALVLRLVDQEAPPWGLALVGQPSELGRRGQLSSDAWFAMLPLVTVEAYVWGLFGSALARRVLPGAAIAAVAAAPVWLFTAFAPSPVFLNLRLVAAAIVLVVSYVAFVNQPREAVLGKAGPEEEIDRRQRFLETWERFERAVTPVEWATEAAPAHADGLGPYVPPVAPTQWAAEGRRAGPAGPPPKVVGGTDGTGMKPDGSARRPRHTAPQAQSPIEVLWWLTLQQACGLVAALAAVGFLFGFVIPAQAQVLWPVATLLLGVACGTATFAAEQRDLSYHFLSSQHFPLGTIWRFKVGFWAGVLVLVTLLIVLGAFTMVFAKVDLRPRAVAVNVPATLHMGTLPGLLGTVSFVGIWLAYGFATAQIIVWLCRKSVLAVLLSGLVSAAALALWLPSLLCGGLQGWQAWLPPLVMFAAGYSLMRAWAAGRIMERKPLAALGGFALAMAAWVAVNYAWRAWEVPDVGSPMDAEAFRSVLPRPEVNIAGKKIQEASTLSDDPRDAWQDRLAEVARLPLGVIDVPRGDGQLPLTRHFPACLRMGQLLRERAKGQEPGPALDHVVQMLALSRNLRNKAMFASYSLGAAIEEMGVETLEDWLARGKPDPELLRRALKGLNRHAAETPTPLDCLQTECFVSSGALAIPATWSFASGQGGAAGKIAEEGLAGAVALSLEMPWEAERKTRLWQVVWAGLFRGMNTPHWQLPAAGEKLQPTQKENTANILAGWLPASGGPEASLNLQQTAQLLDASWLSDERLFCSVARLRAVATRSRWRVDAARQAVALGLYHMDNAKPAAQLVDLVPKYLPDGLPDDPYSGQKYRYRISPGEHVVGAGAARPGQGVLWSTGPDRTDHGGQNHGGPLRDDDAQWGRGGFDLVTLAPLWP
jgi:hypothetical protein